MMVLLMRFEMVRELRNTPAQDGYLNFWRPVSVLMGLVLRNYACLTSAASAIIE